jgi:hypothetical protein
MFFNGMTPHIAGTSLSAQARYAAGSLEILQDFFDGTPIREEYLVFDGGALAGTGAESYKLDLIRMLISRIDEQASSQGSQHLSRADPVALDIKDLEQVSKESCVPSAVPQPVVAQLTRAACSGLPGPRGAAVMRHGVWFRRVGSALRRAEAEGLASLP